MYMRLKFVFLIIILVESISISGCFAQGVSWKEASQKGSGILEVAYSENSPFIFQSSNGQLAGIEYDLLINFTTFLMDEYGVDITIEWQHMSTFEMLYDSLKFSKKPMLGIASLSITDARKNEITLSDPYLPDIEIIVTSDNLPVAANLKKFSKIIQKSNAVSVVNSTFEKNIFELKENYFSAITLSYVPNVDVLIDSISNTDNRWGYISLPNYLAYYRNNRSLTRQRFFMVENEGITVAGTVNSDWHIPFNVYLKTPSFKSFLQNLVDKYLGPTFNNVVWSISGYYSDSLASKGVNKEVGLLTLEKELQDMQIKQNELELRTKNLIIIFGVGGIILILVALIAVIRMVRLKSETNIQLKDKNKRIESQSMHLKRSYENLKILSTIGQDISANLSVEKINEIAYESLSNFMDVGVFGIGLYNNEDQVLEFSGVMEKGKRLDYFNYDIDDELRLASKCFRENKEIVIQNLSSEYQDYLKKVPDTKQGENASSIIYMPLSQGNKNIGVLTVQSFNKEAFSDHQIDIVRNIANYSKIALDNAAAYELIYKQAEILSKANREIQKNNEYIAQQNKELISLNREKNDLIGIVAHDLKNPLASAMSVTDTFKGEENINQDQKEYLYLIAKCLGRMNHLIEKILDIKLLESKKLDLNLEPTDLKNIIEPVVDQLRIQAENKSISITRDIISSSAIIDPNFAVDIFENLISNAIKFSNIGTNISIKVSENEKNVVVEVGDEGPGFTEDDKTKLFGKFQKLSAKPTGGETSTGLGLSIVKKYVDAMNGSIRCDSEPGKGTNSPNRS
jgi:signal transduction histidine kinase